ncbi:helix-turn-helix domain-containing protein [Streptomyces sp. NPDC102406]|uniref:helix-turn-helix domain-containing protein n=1 Tax=Streptomyces sp. NPDC102406 TaxID=3366171 RepID=UPI003806EE08
MHQPLTFEVNADAIREERMQAGMSRGRLAELAKVTERYVGHLERGTRRRMQPPTFARLRDALGTTDERLTSPRPTEDSPPTPPPERE